MGAFVFYASWFVAVVALLTLALWRHPMRGQNARFSRQEAAPTPSLEPRARAAAAAGFSPASYLVIDAETEGVTPTVAALLLSPDRRTLLAFVTKSTSTEPPSLLLLSFATDGRRLASSSLGRTGLSRPSQVLARRRIGATLDQLVRVHEALIRAHPDVELVKLDPDTAASRIEQHEDACQAHWIAAGEYELREGVYHMTASTALSTALM